MPDTPDSSTTTVCTPEEQIQILSQELEKKQKYIKILEDANKDLEAKVRNASETTEPPAPVNELEETGELVATKPALGLNDEEVRRFRVRATQGISGQVFRDKRPEILYDAINDPRTLKENVALLNVRNGVCVPLVVEKRDSDNRVIESTTIGVLHVFNKRYGNVFIEEDVHLLERMARNAAAVVASAQM